nr:hypothetical protein [uncultured Aminipila sp.]
MAEYKQRIDTAEIYSCDGYSPRLNQSGIDTNISRDNLTIESYYDYDDGEQEAGAYSIPKVLVVKHTLADYGIYNKKRVKNIEVKGKISEVTAEGSGKLASGSFRYPYSIMPDSTYAGDKYAYVVPQFGYIGNIEYYLSDYYNGMTAGNIERFYPNEKILEDIKDNIKKNQEIRMVISLSVNSSKPNWAYEDRSYSGHGKIQFDSVERPYIEITYEDVIPEAINVYPGAGFVDEKADNVFGWDFSYDKNLVGEELKQQAAIFRWRPKGSTTSNDVAINGETKKVVIPANTFTTEAIEWQVVVTSNDGISSTADNWYMLSTVDSISMARAEYPNHIVIDGLLDNYFSWLHTIATGTKQTKYDLQYSINNGIIWNDLKSEETPDTHTTIPKGTFIKGNLMWRVRTYNTDGVAGAWSDPASVAVRTKPETPGVSTFTETPFPEIKWSSAEQQAFQIKCGTFESEPIFGTDKYYKISEIITDGTFNLGVRVIDQFNVKSDWANVTVNIKNNPTGSISLLTTAKEHVQLKWQGNFNEYRIYRDDILIKTTTEKSFTDYLSSGKHRYQVIGISNNFYTKSKELIEIAKPECAMIAEIGKYEFVKLRFTAENDTYEYSISPQIEFKHYTGRRLPIATTTDFKDQEYSFAYCTKSKRELDFINSLVGKLVVWKNYEKVIVGILTDFDVKDWKIKNFSFSIMECDLEGFDV